MHELAQLSGGVLLGVVALTATAPCLYLLLLTVLSARLPRSPASTRCCVP